MSQRLEELSLQQQRRCRHANLPLNSCTDSYVDPDEQENRVGERVETEMIELLRTGLASVDAPAEQLVRLGLD